MCEQHGHGNARNSDKCTHHCCRRRRQSLSRQMKRTGPTLCRQHTLRCVWCLPTLPSSRSASSGAHPVQSLCDFRKLQHLCVDARLLYHETWCLVCVKLCGQLTHYSPLLPGRCLDLYLCPRVRQRRVHIDDPKSLLPSLPKPRDLQPFPTRLAKRFIGHTAHVRSKAKTCSSSAPPLQRSLALISGLLLLWQQVLRLHTLADHADDGRVEALPGAPKSSNSLAAACR
jgi:BOP1NT (NUC169) domain